MSPVVEGVGCQRFVQLVGIELRQQLRLVVAVDEGPRDAYLLHEVADVHQGRAVVGAQGLEGNGVDQIPGDNDEVGPCLLDDLKVDALKGRPVLFVGGEGTADVEVRQLQDLEGVVFRVDDEASVRLMLYGGDVLRLEGRGTDGQVWVQRQAIAVPPKDGPRKESDTEDQVDHPPCKPVPPSALLFGQRQEDRKTQKVEDQRQGQDEEIPGPVLQDDHRHGVYGKRDHEPDEGGKPFPTRFFLPLFHAHTSIHGDKVPASQTGPIIS